MVPRIVVPFFLEARVAEDGSVGCFRPLRFYPYGWNLIGEYCGRGWLPTGVVGIEKLFFIRLYPFV